MCCHVHPYNKESALYNDEMYVEVVPKLCQLRTLLYHRSIIPPYKHFLQFLKLSKLQIILDSFRMDFSKLKKIETTQLLRNWIVSFSQPKLKKNNRNKI